MSSISPHIVWFLRNMVWPHTKIFLCLWHVKKAWADNAMKKISSVGERTIVFQMLGDIIYKKCCNVVDDPIDWALEQLDKISNTHPLATACMRYIIEVWRAKTPMWCVKSNKKQKGIVALAIIRANDIPDTSVLICIDENVVYVGTVHNRPKVWTIKCPDSE